MTKKRMVWFTGVILSVALMLGGCGDDVDAVVPLTGPVSVEGEAIEDSGEISTEDNDAEDVGGSTKAEEDQAEPEKENAEKEPEPEIVTITISAAGDCALGNYHLQDYYNSFNQTYEKETDDSYFFANVAEIFAEDDLTLVNFEGTLTTSETPAEGRTYNIKGDPAYAKLLTAGNIEAVSMGNNHRLDYGIEGSDDTVAALTAEGITYAYDNIVGIYETKGITIGYVSVNETSWGYGSEKIVKEGIAELQEAGVGIIIACCHWGVERDHYTEEYQNELGRICIDAGADLVLGHHPHVLQGIEQYQGKYIVYSLANFSFGANRNPSDKDTMIFQQTFTFVDGEKQEEAQARVIPCSISSVKERNNYQPTPLTGEDAERVIERLNTYSEEYGVVVAEDGTIRIDGSGDADN